MTSGGFRPDPGCPKWGPGSVEDTPLALLRYTIMQCHVVRVHTHPLYVDIEDVCVTSTPDMYSAIWTDLGILVHHTPLTPWWMDPIISSPLHHVMPYVGQECTHPLYVDIEDVVYPLYL